MVTEAAASRDTALYYNALMTDNWIPKGPSGAKWGYAIIAESGDLADYAERWGLIGTDIYIYIYRVVGDIYIYIYI